MEQSSLFGFEPLPKKLKRSRAPTTGKNRLFFALFPTGTTVERLLTLGALVCNQHGLFGPLQAGDRLHLTLDHIGDFDTFPDEVVASAKEAADALAARGTWSPFSVSLDHFSNFGVNGKAKVLRDKPSDNSELKAFRASLWDALAVRELPGSSRSQFAPHVTLLYEDRVLPEQQFPPITWTAGEFVLVHSKLGETRHARLASWPLQGA